MLFRPRTGSVGRLVLALAPGLLSGCMVDVPEGPPSPCNAAACLPESGLDGSIAVASIEAIGELFVVAANAEGGLVSARAVAEFDEQGVKVTGLLVGVSPEADPPVAAVALQVNGEFQATLELGAIGLVDVKGVYDHERALGIAGLSTSDRGPMGMALFVKRGAALLSEPRTYRMTRIESDPGTLIVGERADATLTSSEFKVSEVQVAGGARGPPFVGVVESTGPRLVVRAQDPPLLLEGAVTDQHDAVVFMRHSSFNGSRPLRPSLWVGFLDGAAATRRQIVGVHQLQGVTATADGRWQFDQITLTIDATAHFLAQSLAGTFSGGGTVEVEEGTGFRFFIDEGVELVGHFDTSGEVSTFVRMELAGATPSVYVGTRIAHTR